MDYNGEGVKEGEIPTFAAKASHEAKLRELLCNINSSEIKVCSYASKEFIKLLKGETGEELLHQYVSSSSTCSELLEAWKIQHGHPGMSYIMSLISAILNHSSGKYIPNDSSRISISRVLDKFASLIVKEKTEDVYKEFNSKEPKRQKAGLLLMASIVRRGSGLANEVANSFNFKLPVFSKLAEYRYKPTEKKRKDSTRKSFVWFAMSFLEVGKPWLLRGVIQQKEMYSGVLRGLANDDEETIDYILSTLRDKVLTAESLVRPSLRSVLFGSATLELLANISGRGNGGEVVELAHQVLVMVCTDPCNGLMPDLKRHPNPLKGNLKRLVDLMKKLKATEIVNHKNLLLAIVSGRPTFGSAYLNEFPYNLDDHGSPIWLAAVCLAANLISAVGTGLSSMSPPVDSLEVHNFMKCICPRPFTRLVINKGLLHSDSFVKHGTLRLLLESLQLLDSLIDVLNNSSLKQEVQNEVQTLLPDPQVLLKLISSMSSNYKSPQGSMKRKRTVDLSPNQKSNGLKKLKTDDEDSDIIVSGINSYPDISLHGESEKVMDAVNADESDLQNPLHILVKIWDLHDSFVSNMTLKEAEDYFYAKLLDTLKMYFRTMPNVLEGSFDFFIDLLSNPLTIPTNLLRSLLSLLTEYIGWSHRSNKSIRTPPLMYKNLQPFINLMLFSPISEIRNEANGLARAAMLSTGAFDRNLLEVGAWFLFLPAYNEDKSSLEMNVNEGVENLSPVVVSFLCDAISTVGNNLFKYWDLVRHYILYSEGGKDMSPDFSPLIICVLQKCLRVVSSETGTFTLPEKAIISSYTSNTLKYILQSQVHAGLLSSLIDSIIFEGSKDHSLLVNDSGDGFCEWRPLRNLWKFSQGFLRKHLCPIISSDKKSMPVDTSFANTLGEVQNALRTSHVDELTGIIKAFSFAIICTTPDEILRNFPLIISISHRLLSIPFSFLSSTLLLDHNLFADISRLWADIFVRGFESVLSTKNSNRSSKNRGSWRIHACSGESSSVSDLDSSESVSVAFSYFLKLAPFHVLFPLIMRIDGLHLLELSNIQDLLLSKLLGRTTDYLRSSLQLVLFSMHQIQVSYRNKPLIDLEQLSEVCLVLLGSMLSNLLVLKPDSENSKKHSGCLLAEFKEVAETIFSHPVVELYLENPIGYNENQRNGILHEDMGVVLDLSSQRVHKMDQHILSILKTTSDYMLSLCTGEEFKIDNTVKKHLGKIFKSFGQRVFLELKSKFSLCIENRNFKHIVATVHALNVLIHSTSPFDLLEFVHWMFTAIDMNKKALGKSTKLSALSIVFYIAGESFEALSDYMKRQVTKRVPYNLFWGLEERNYDDNLFEKIYYKLFYFATCSDLESADLCLLKAINVVFIQKFVKAQSFLPLNVTLRVVESTPMEILSYCLDKTSINKAKVLFALTELSSLHLSVFGNLFVGKLSQDMLSDEELLMLLPAVISYLNSALKKFKKQFQKKCNVILSVYLKVLLRGFVNLKHFMSQTLFMVDCDDFLPSSIDKTLNFFENTLLGKAVCILNYHTDLNGDSIKLKKRLKLFDSICSDSVSKSGLLDCDVSKMDMYSLNQSVNFVNTVIAKISFCRILLCLEDHVYCQSKEVNGDLEEINLGIDSSKLDLSRLQFIKDLVNSWKIIVKKFPSNSEKENITDSLGLFKFLEDFILRTIVEITRKMVNFLVHLQSIPFTEILCRLLLRYRFGDPTALKMLRNILNSLSEGKFSRVTALQLLISHSQFAPTIRSIFKPFGSQFGTFIKPVSGILRSLIVSSTARTEIDGDNIMKSAGMYEKQIEIIKLLRVLITAKSHNCEFDTEKSITINYRELLLLLLSSYGATLDEIDVEIYKLMHDIESLKGLDSVNISDIDYLWGSATLKHRTEQKAKLNLAPSDIRTNTAAIEDQRRSQFRENLPVDYKLCLSTVLYFPYDRTSFVCSSSSNKLSTDNFNINAEVHYSDAKNLQSYDPVYILRFAIHSLSTGYIEPIEFAGLGLSAVVFVSISSPDYGIRKLGYEALGLFQNALENCQKRKDVTKLRLLLSYMQNGIDEPWQKIPSVIAIFAAEASFILLDPSNDHYLTISNMLLGSPKVNLKCIPLFHNLFGSSSANFKTERLWILRLSCAGLNLEDDAQIYIKNSIFEVLLSFYISPLSDTESRELILQILTKGVKLHKLARHLVEQCGLISWLSSIVTFFSDNLLEDPKSYFSSLNAVSEVINNVISSRNITEWMQKNALEQLMELSSHFYKLLIGGKKFTEENIPLVKSILQILGSTIKISQKRRIFQPHLTLSVEGLFEVYQAIKESGSCAVLGLKLVLMSTPPTTIFQMDEEKLLEFISWAATTAMSDTKQNLHLQKVSSEEDSLVLKLLRWLTASAILRKLSNNLTLDVSKRSNSTTLRSILEFDMNLHDENGRSDVKCEEIIATTIFHLQQLLGNDCTILPSVASALCLLLPRDASNSTESGLNNLLLNCRNLAPSPLSSIRCPAEANPAWRWSYYQPWKDNTIEQTDMERIDEQHACQTLLVMISNMFGKKSSGFRVLTYEDIEDSGIFNWEKSIILEIE